jgi:hypothetical protein
MASYQVVSIWWPDGWEPQTPLDVPKCIRPLDPPASAATFTYQQAVASVSGLNRQNMAQPGTGWHVVTADDAGPVPEGGVLVEGAPEGLHVVRAAGGTGGDCSRCPAHDFPCAKQA